MPFDSRLRVDLGPYSGMDIHHVFVYQNIPSGVRMLFCCIVRNGIDEVSSISFRYEDTADELIISATDTIVLLRIHLAALWSE